MPLRIMLRRSHCDQTRHAVTVKDTAPTLPIRDAAHPEVNHELKCSTEFFDAIACFKKTFEIRRNDRDFRVGDRLMLREWDGHKFIGRWLARRVTYITDYEQKKGFVVMSIDLDYIKARR
jgi:hypothetical protein